MINCITLHITSVVFVFDSCKFMCNISPRLSCSEILHIKRIIGLLVVLFLATLIQMLLYLLLMKSGVLKILVQFLHLSIFFLILFYINIALFKLQ